MFSSWLFVGMEVWREELNCALASGLGCDDEYNDFEEDFFLQLVAMVSDEVPNEATSLYLKHVAVGLEGNSCFVV